MSRRQLSPQLSPQMRPPACQPPALPCGRPQDQLGNAARRRSHTVLLSLGLSPFLLHWGWQWLDGRVLGGSCTPSAPACLLGCFFLHGLSSPFLFQLPRVPILRQAAPVWVPWASWWWPPQHLPEPLSGSEAGDEQPFEKIPWLGGLV